MVAPTPVQIMNTPDPITTESLHVAWNTFDVTAWAFGVAILAAILAGVALYVALHEFRDTVRRPNLEPRQWTDFSLQDADTWNRVVVGVSVLNNGQRLTRQFLVELLVPLTALNNPPKTDHEEVRRIGKTDYFVYQQPINKTFYPNNVLAEVHRFQFGIKPDVSKFTVLWRIYDDYGNYPKKNFGQWVLERT